MLLSRSGGLLALGELVAAGGRLRCWSQVGVPVPPGNTAGMIIARIITAILCAFSGFFRFSARVFDVFSTLPLLAACVFRAAELLLLQRAGDRHETPGFAPQRANAKMVRVADLRRRRNRAGERYASSADSKL